MSDSLELVSPLDANRLRSEVEASVPFPHFCVDNFLRADFANEIADQFPSYQESIALGKSFSAVNERGKVQVTDSSTFPPAIGKLNDLLASPEFLDLLSEIMGIPNLLADDALAGGGTHQTGPRGHLDVHVDFNYLKERKLHRRLNILVYFNRNWQPEWGGNIELWDRDVKDCHRSLSPIFNRCVAFETSEISYHGVTAVTCPDGITRNSMAAYYYTKEAPAGWSGTSHSTVFKARPNEVVKRFGTMPAEKVKRWFASKLRATKKLVRGNH